MHPETSAILFLGLFVVLGGCSAPDHKTTPPPIDTGLTTEGFSGVTDRYDPDHLTVVDAQLEEAEWAALLMETRLFYELLLGPECLEELIPNIFE